MIELLGLGIAGVVGVLGHLRTRDFTWRRLRYTKVGENPELSGVAAGVGATLLAAPVVALLPVVGAATALALGAGVGTGIIRGARETREE